MEVVRVDEVENFSIDEEFKPESEDKKKSQATYNTPSGLNQFFTVVDLRRRLVVLLSFLADQLK